LIRQQFDRNDILQVKNPKPLKLRGINQLLDILLYKSGLHELVHRTERHRKDKRRKTARANDLENTLLLKWQNQTFILK
jgi:hypothetical protein